MTRLTNLTPVLRFRKFSDNWEIKKYADLGEGLSGGSLSYADLSEGGMHKCVLYGELYTHYDCIIKNITYRTNVKANTVIKNDVLFPQSTTVDALSLISPACMNEETAETSGVFVIRPRSDIDGNFIAYYTKGKAHQRQKLAKKAQGLTIVHLYYQSIKDETICIPTYSEQIKISNLFLTIDNFISFIQSKLDKLINIRQTLSRKTFPNNGEDTPEIRFKGFNSKWEWRTFDKIITRIATGLNPRDNFKLNIGGNNYYVTIKNFEHGHIHLDDRCDKIDDDALRIIQERSDLKKDDILFSSIGRVGDCYLIEKDPKNWNINESVFSLRPDQNIADPLYTFHVIHADCVLSYILSNVTGSTFKSIKIFDLKKIILPIPDKFEQRKLGTFLSRIDDLITLYQYKLEKLTDIKKACLDAMFV